MINRRNLMQGAMALSALPLWTTAHAAPLSQVKIMYGFPAGSAGDSVARRVAEKLGGTSYSTNPAYVENKPGAAGRVAIVTLKNSPANGSVLVMAPVTAFALDPLIEKDVGYTWDDVQPISIGAVMVHGLAVGPAVPAHVKDLKGFVAWAKANPEQVNFGSPGAGSMPHLLGTLLSARAGVEIKHVPYRGTIPAITDLVGGQIASTMSPCGDYLQYVKAGRLRVLATSGHQRSPFLPDVPTFTEQGFAEVTIEEWFGFYAPAKIPTQTLAAANAAITAALKDSAVIDALALVGMIPRPTKPQEMLASQKALADHWGPIVRQIGFSPRS